jgi:serine/threonine protein kinase
MSNDAHPSLIGRTLGNRYVLERLLGTGAMGTVYCARQIELGPLVAIKVLHPSLATDQRLVQRFEGEAFATSRLDHPNALRVLDFGEDGGLLYLVTEYVEAEDLLTVMEAEWPLNDERVVAMLSQVLSALIAVHEVGIVHRDLKPENILVIAGRNDDGTRADLVKVCDFGIAKVARQTLEKLHSFVPQPTAEGVLVGTPDYMSPEQARGQPVDGRSDLYSVGVVLYHLLAGRTPFTADTPVGIALQHVSEAPVPPSHYRKVHPALEAICLRALSKRPEDRFQTASDMRNALRKALTTDSMAAFLAPPQVTSFVVASGFSASSPAMIGPRESNARTHFRKYERPRRRRALGYAAVASAAAITAFAFVAARRSHPSDPIEMVDHVQATALVSPPSVGIAFARTLTPETAQEEESAAVVDESPATMEPTRRLPMRRPSPSFRHPSDRHPSNPERPRRRAAHSLHSGSAYLPRLSIPVTLRSPSSASSPVRPFPGRG